MNSRSLILETCIITWIDSLLTFANESKVYGGMEDLTLPASFIMTDELLKRWLIIGRRDIRALLDHISDIAEAFGVARHHRSGGLLLVADRVRKLLYLALFLC